MAFFLKPGFNGTTPGCDGSSCHTHKSQAITSATVQGLKVQVQLNAPAGKTIAGELVDGDGNVVDVNNGVKTNPFTLTAQAPGTYRINAGYSSSGRVWDSASVTIIASGVNDNNSGESNVILYQNHPNPVSGSTMIRYYLPKANNVTLSVYDLKGSLILELVNEPQAEGYHQVILDGNYLQAGSYEYILRTGNNTVSQKMVVIK